MWFLWNVVSRDATNHGCYTATQGVYHAYQSVAMSALRTTGILDSGANINILKDECAPFMTDVYDSGKSVGGFHGKQVRAHQDGTAFLYMFDPKRPGDGSTVSLPATTMKGDVNATLISAWHIVHKLGFVCTLSPTGFSGFTRKEKDGST